MVMKINLGYQMMSYEVRFCAETVDTDRRNWSMVFQAITPPPGKVLNCPDGIKVTAPRVEMRGGRILAYQEQGVKKERARHYIFHVHGHGGSRLDPIAIPTEVMNELGLYVVSFDRAGYGEAILTRSDL